MEYDGGMAIAKGRHIRRIGKRNQVTIPADILEELHLGPGVEVEVTKEGRGLRIRPVQDPIAYASGLLRRPGQRVLSDEELEVAIREASQEAATRRYLRTLPGG
jgi:AbrB family looped-hinge helix DNA binding protein